MNCLYRKLTLVQLSCRYFSVSATTLRMNNRLLKRHDLESMSKEQLIGKVLDFQGQYRQMLNKKETTGSKLDQMVQRFKPEKRRKKKEKEIDFKECKYRRIAFKVAYLGWDYNGLQANNNVEDTIEDILREAFRQVKLAAADDPLRFSRCGRTDKGVSAFQQVITVRLRTRLKSGFGVTSWVDPATLTRDDRETRSDDERMGDGDPPVVRKVKSDNGLATSNQEETHEDERMGDVNHVVAGNVKLNAASMQEEACEDENKKMGDGVEDVKSGDNVAASTQEKTHQDEDAFDQEEYDFPLILNRILPPEIRILGWSPLDGDAFSARHSCVGREYRYYFTKGNLDVPRMNEAAKLFCGLHDFRNFAKINVSNSTEFNRRIDEFEIEECDDEIAHGGSFAMCCATIVGSGFLYHQVRNMMALLYRVGSGFESSEVITELLDVERHERKPSYGLAEANSLVLYRTYFEGMRWRISKQARHFLTTHLLSYWNDLAVKTTLTRQLIASIEDDATIVVQEDKSDFPDTFHGAHSNFTLAGFSYKPGKTYKKVMDLPKGKTVEEKTEMLERKRQRLNQTDDDSEAKITKISVE